MSNNVTVSNTSTGVLSAPPTIAPSAPPSVMTTMIEVDSGLIDESVACAFCPSPNSNSSTMSQNNALYVPYPDKAFIASQDDKQDPLTCGGLAQIYEELQTAEECDSTRDIFNETFDPSIYCQCPNVIETGICFLCLERNTNDVLTPETPMNGATCGDYADLAKAAQTTEFCQSILALKNLQETCCLTVTGTPAPTDTSNNSNNNIDGSISSPSTAPPGTTVSSTAASSSCTPPISSRSRLVRAGVIFFLFQGFLMVGFDRPFFC